ncbi:Ribonuclease H domain [Macleaya cordata]|uniref:Ribonuclease H domain n=1 Tax=Macleaya cordata TaxID=56857 RepID=A0A200QXV4_MACCD|nr:Ribonuclease H domain [Macleaya cordata]
MWKILTDSSNWGKFFLAKYTNPRGKWITFYKKTSIWKGVQWAFDAMVPHMGWIVRDGTSISLWGDIWCSDRPISSILDLDSMGAFSHKSRVSEIISNGDWCIPEEVATVLSNLGVISLDRPLGDEDRRVWKPDIQGKFSVSSAYELTRVKSQKVPWQKWIWLQCIHPNLSARAWKLLHGCGATESKAQARGIPLASRCHLCYKDDHVLWLCPFANNLWDWIHSLFNFRRAHSFIDMMKRAQYESPNIKEIWVVDVLVMMTEIWGARNKCAFEDTNPSLDRIKSMVFKYIGDSSLRMKGYMHNSVHNLSTFRRFGVMYRPTKTLRVRDCLWVDPEPGELKICCDGTSTGNPGNAGAGVVFRDSDRSFLAGISGGLKVCSNYAAETSAIIIGVEWALDNGFTHFWVVSDSKVTIENFKKGKIPWWLWGRWISILNRNPQMHISHVYRETNFLVDSMAKRGAHLGAGQLVFFNQRPSFLFTIEHSDNHYYRFY